MENMTFAEVWAVVAAVAAAVILLVNAAEKIVVIWRTIHAPDAAQDDRGQQHDFHIAAEVFK